MVPNGWDYQPLSKLLEKIIDYRGQSVPKADNGVPLITARNVRDGYLDFTSKEYVSDQDFESWMKRGTPRAGDIIFTTEAPLGKACRFPETGRFAVGQRTVTLRTNSMLDSDYLLYFILSEHGQNLINLSSSGSTAKGIKSSELKKVKISFPTNLSEQNKIAQILSTWDRAISTAEQLLTNSQQQKKALMQQLLPGRKRLLDKNGVRFSGEWKTTKLSKMGKIVSGGTPDTNTKEFWDGEISWLTPTDVTALKSRFVLSTARTISDAGVKNSSATLLPAGSLMVCTRATIGALAISKTEICTNQGFKNIIPYKNFDVNFIYYTLLYNTLELVRKASGSTFLELSKKDFENIELPCPLLEEEQQKIATVLSTADQEISALQQKLDALKQEKKALMQQLLTGKRRVKVEVAA
ncbi:restriction endonuclease subunit S [Aeromonas veronii]|uniref:restriction endonuclease subunit S n=1 Tax=Aeromonas veronii TaxID=654 RepID=UPI0014303FD8|nr:restriction endonuclease subunit S [Aeromonas veronii]NJI22898.1 restriction endonuclease subunit S [Aeromonas veronii]NJI35374.1 restriction endonuclease subunit S [Aeromonas veronii]